MILEIIILVVLLAGSAFFSASEVAFVSLREARLEVLKNKGIKNISLVLALRRNLRRLLVIVLVGNNVVNIAASSLVTIIASKYFHSTVLAIILGVLTLIILVFCEIIPKAYASNHPKKVAIFTAPFLNFFGIVGYPIIIIFEKLSGFFAGKHKPELITEEEIKVLTTKGAEAGVIEPHESEMIERLFKLNDTTVERVMTPWDQVAFFYLSDSLRQISEKIKKYSHSRYPVLAVGGEKVVGSIFSRDILVANLNNQGEKTVENIIRPVIIVKNRLPLDDVMREFSKKKAHLAIVVNDADEPIGLITFKDIIEELVGEIE